FDTSSAMSSSGNIYTQNHCTMLRDVSLAVSDTLVILDPESGALMGNGEIKSGSVRRTISHGNSELYRFESPRTSVRFDTAGSQPSAVTMTVFPDSDLSSAPINWTVIPSSNDSLANTIIADSVTHFSKWAIGLPRPNGGVPVVQQFYVIDAVGGSGF